MNVMKDHSKFKNASSLFMGLVIFLAVFMVTQHVNALESTNLSKNVDLGNPFLVEHYQTEPYNPDMIKNNISSSFSGKGVINGTTNITAEGIGAETFRNNDTSYIRGEAKYVTDNNETAVYAFYAIGNYRINGSFDSSGIAVFDDGATGKLSFLSNSIGIYKDQVDKNGNGTFLMWHWK